MVARNGDQMFTLVPLGDNSTLIFFLCVVLGLNPGPCVCQASTLPTELQPRPPLCYFSFFCP